MKNIIIFALVSSVLVACGTATQKAPVEDRQFKQGQLGSTTPTSQPTGGPATYTVKKGDTLYRIATENGQSYTDLIIWNNLANPHDIKVGQTLKVAPPETGTSVIASPNVVEVRPLGAPIANSTSSASVVTPPSSNNKHGPRADKRPYSDATLAELQKSDAADGLSAKAAAAPEAKVADTAAAAAPAASAIAWGWPVEGKVTTPFDGVKNKGVDFAGKAGQSVYAAAAGTVLFAGPGMRGYGNLVIIKHPNNFISAYAHNQTILVKEKQVISKGQKIAEMGSSDSDAVKLHFEIRQQSKPLDPTKFLPNR